MNTIRNTFCFVWLCILIVSCDEYPTLSPDGKKLFFGPNRPLPASWNRKTASHIFNIWVMERNGNGRGEPYPINPEANKGICINYIDNQGAIYYNTDFPRIAKSEYKNGLFTGPIELNTPVPSTECFFAPDNSYVVYSSLHPGYGKLDLFVSSVSHDGTWGKSIFIAPMEISTESQQKSSNS